jgi:hypothetical protein
VKSTVKPNGDVIKQSDLETILATEAALNALLLNLKRRLAEGARVQRGRYDVDVEEFRLGRNIDMKEEAAFLSSWTGTYCGIQIDRPENLRSPRKVAA